MFLSKGPLSKDLMGRAGKIGVGVGLVYASLVLALVARLIRVVFLFGLDNSAAIEAFARNAFSTAAETAFPILLVASVAFLLRSWLAQPKNLVRLLLFEALFQTVLFGLILLLAGQLTSNAMFLRDTLVVAWLFALLGGGAVSLVRRLNQAARERFLYNRGTQVFIDCAMLTVAFVMAYLARFDGIPDKEFQKQLLLVLPYAVALQVGVNYLKGVYRFVWRFVGLREALVIGEAVLMATIVFLSFNLSFWYFWDFQRVPLGVMLIFSVFSLAGLTGARVIRRLQFQASLSRKNRAAFVESRRFLLVGAGQAGTLLCKDLEHRSDFELVGFLDDDPRKKNRTICGLKVLGTTLQLEEVAQKHSVEEVILCMPTASRSVQRKIVVQCEKLGLKTLTIPAMSEIVLGKVNISRLKPVRMEDLLGRLSVEYPAEDVELIRMYQGKRILITGAGGSIGSELARQLKEFEPDRLMLLDKDENNLYEIGLEIAEEYAGPVAEEIADIRDRDRVERIFEQYRPEVVFHAAAYKHVPMMERHPGEAVLNNVIGSRNLVELASAFEAESFVLISTDKAVNPTNVMGASKRIAEMIVQRQAAAAQTAQTRYCGVRFGNVLGSRASVVPLFQKRIAQGKNLTVTHPEVRRYFMTIPEAVQLVIQAGSLGRCGEIFVLDMGNPVKIADLARELIELSGLVPGRDLQIEFTGLRPGEKLYEELLIGSENGVRDTRYSKIFVADPVGECLGCLDSLLPELEAAARVDDRRTIYRLFEQAGIGYDRSNRQDAKTPSFL